MGRVQTSGVSNSLVFTPVVGSRAARESQDRSERKSQCLISTTKGFIETCRYAESEEIPCPGLLRDREGQGKIQKDQNMQEKFWWRLSAEHGVPGKL